MSYYGNTNSSGFYGGNSSGGAFGQPQQPSDTLGGTGNLNEQPQQQQYDGSSGNYSQQQQQQQAPAFITQQWQPQAMQQQQPAASYNNMHQQQQQQQQQQPVSFWNPAMTTATMAAVAGGNADAALDLVSNAGKSFLQSKTASMVPGVSTSMQLLRTYFAVDNRYVVRKMKKVLFPFLSKQWKRAELSHSNSYDNQQQQQQVLYATSTPHYSLPVQDENAPDLYIPCMSLITYVLLCALAHGTAGPLDPQVIPGMATWCLVVQTLEVLAVRVCLYVMLQQPSHHNASTAAASVTLPILDLFSYTGYKYLGLCVNLMVSLTVGGRLLGLLGGGSAYYLAFSWTALATSFFMLKTMANVIPATGGPKREIMVLAFAASQLASMWIVSIATKVL